MIDDVADLVIHQLLIQRGKNGAFTTCRNQDFQTLGTIPQQGAHSFIAGNSLVIVKRVGKSGGTCGNFSEGGFFSWIRTRSFAGLSAMPSGDFGVGVDGGAVV